MLESRNLTKCFGRVRAVDDISLTLEAGHIYAMMGPNGSGKTTWMKMAAGLIKPTAGVVNYQGSPVGIESRRYVAYMSTEPYFYSWMTAMDAGRYYQDFFDDFSLQKYLGMLQSAGLDAKTKISSMSSGMTAKLKIALTLSRDSKVYMLDEPFNGIDLLARDEIRSWILEAASPEKLLLMSSHLVEEMESIADRAVFINGGHLIEVRDLAEMHDKEGISMTERYRQIYGHQGGKSEC